MSLPTTSVWQQLKQLIGIQDQSIEDDPALIALRLLEARYSEEGRIYREQIEGLKEDKQKLERDNNYLIGKLMLATGLERLDLETVQEPNGKEEPQRATRSGSWLRAKQALEAESRRQSKQDSENNEVIHGRQ